MKKIIDISDYQKGANLATALTDGVDAFIFRLGWGNDEEKQDDASFETFVSQAEELKVPWGCYIFSYALTIENVKSEVKHVFRVLNGRKPKLGVWFDLENSEYKRRSGFDDLRHPNLCREFVNHFISAMEEQGLISGLYCDLNHVRNIGFDVQRLWVAAYYDGNNPPVKCDMWQYTSTKAVNGIADNVDCNKVYAEWINNVIDGMITLGSGDDNEIEVNGEDDAMKLSRNRLVYEINRFALTVMGREIGDAETYADYIEQGEIDWYEFTKRIQESPEAVKYWIRNTLYKNILQKEPDNSEVEWWYLVYEKTEINKAEMVEGFKNDYEALFEKYKAILS